jgi:hypothetical protein
MIPPPANHLYYKDMKECLVEIDKLMVENARYKTALEHIKKHMEISIGMHKLSTTWNIAERALSNGE